MSAAKFYSPPPTMPISLAARAGDIVTTATLGPHFFAVENVTYGGDGRVIDDGSGLGHLDLEAQTHATFANVRAALESAGCTLADVFDITVWLADPRDFATMNRVFAGYFTTNRPTRTVLGTTFMFNCKIEMKAWAYKPLPAESRP